MSPRRYDELPQPFRFINRLLSKVVDDAIELADQQARSTLE